MSVIYQPKGKAREYSPLALNIYLTCTHKCAYCYAPRCRSQTFDEYFKKPYPRKGIIDALEKELKINTPKEQVLLSFIGDVYCETMDDNRTTHECLELLYQYHVPVAILTKGGKRCLKDIELFRKFGEHIHVGATLTFDDDYYSSKWESGAALPSERLETLKILHDEGIHTFASFEPVVVPSQSLMLMKKTLGFVDTYKVGKLNNFRGYDQRINWEDFLTSALSILRPAQKDIYIKYDLRQNAPSVQLEEKEINADIHCVR